MEKREVTAFGDDFLTSAGDWFMTTMDIKEMKAKEKRLREETIHKRKEAKGKEKLEIAKMLYKERQKKKAAAQPLKGQAFKAQQEAEILEAYLSPIKEKMEKGEPLTQEDLNNLYMYRGYRKTDVTGMPKGGGKGGATASQWVSALQKNQDDRVGVINKLRGEIDPNSELQIAVDYMGEFDKVKTVEELGELHKKALAELNAMAKEGKIDIPLVNSTISSLNFYKELSEDRIWYQQQAGRPTTIQRPQTKTEIPITGAGEGAPDEVLMMDEIIKGIR